MTYEDVHYGWCNVLGAIQCDADRPHAGEGMRPSRMNSSFSAARTMIESRIIMYININLVVAAYLLNSTKRDDVRRFKYLMYIQSSLKNCENTF